METFESKVDGWFVAGGVVAAVGAAAGFYVSLREGALAGLIVSPIAPALVAWIWRTTRYDVTASSLEVRCAFLHRSIPLPSITHLRRTTSILSAPALSLDRIEVQHAAGSIVISPRDRDRFVRAILARNPAVNAEALSNRAS